MGDKKVKTEEVKTVKTDKSSSNLKAKYLKANLPTLEISIYSAVWIGAVLYACYNVYLTSKSENDQLVALVVYPKNMSFRILSTFVSKRS